MNCFPETNFKFTYLAFTSLFFEEYDEIHIAYIFFCLAFKEFSYFSLKT